MRVHHTRTDPCPGPGGQTASQHWVLGFADKSPGQDRLRNEDSGEQGGTGTQHEEWAQAPVPFLDDATRTQLTFGIPLVPLSLIAIRIRPSHPPILDFRTSRRQSVMLRKLLPYA
jgi:hypothetical protein